MNEHDKPWSSLAEPWLAVTSQQQSGQKAMKQTGVEDGPLLYPWPLYSHAVRACRIPGPVTIGAIM